MTALLTLCIVLAWVVGWWLVRRAGDVAQRAGQLDAT